VIVSINYSDQNFKKKQQLNSWTAKHIGKVDKVISYSSADIDLEFFEANKEILTQKRGGGYWLWKPYIILKTLNELNDGDFLFYVDSGIQFIKNVNGLITKLEKSGQEIMVFQLPLLEIQWTKKEVFDYFGISNNDFLYSNQIMGSTLCLKKNENSVSFVMKWLEICQNQSLLLPSSNLHLDEYKCFIAHRDDQSLLSVLSKISNIKPFSDPTDFGKFPYQYLKTNRLFNITEFDTSFSLNETYFLHNRTNNPFLYFFKYLIKIGLFRLGLFYDLIL
jgi:hypothetical protein